MKKLRYTFEEVQACEMCGDKASNHKILGQRLNRSQGLKPKSKTGISVSVMKCTNCELIYSQPQPIPFEIQDHYGVPPEDYWTPEYFNWTPDYFSGQIKVAKDILPFRDGMTALDIGAGIGKCMLSLANAGFDAYGLEPSVTFYEKAISKMNINPEKLKLGMVEEVEYQNASFDFITYGAVFEHIYHPAQTLEKALNWLKPNGIIHIEVPSSKHLVAKLFNYYFKIVGTNYVTHISPMHTPFHLYEFGLKSFEELSKRIRFKIEKYQYDACEIWHIPNILHSSMSKYMELTDTGMQLTVYLRKIN